MLVCFGVLQSEKSTVFFPSHANDAAHCELRKEAPFLPTLLVANCAQLYRMACIKKDLKKMSLVCHLSKQSIFIISLHLGLRINILTGSKMHMVICNNAIILHTQPKQIL